MWLTIIFLDKPCQFEYILSMVHFKCSNSMKWLTWLLICCCQPSCVAFLLFYQFPIKRTLEWWDAVLQKRLALALFVLLLSTLMCCQPTELILGFFFFLLHKFSILPPPPPATLSPSCRIPGPPPQARSTPVLNSLSMGLVGGGGGYCVWCVMCDVWCVMCDMWCVMCDMWWGMIYIVAI